VATLDRLARDRHDAYAEIAHTRVDTDGRSVDAVADLVLAAFDA
jgi:hypothetical protein